MTIPLWLVIYGGSCTAIISFYTLLMIYACFEAWWTNR